MIDLGLTKIALIGVVALVVIGPEKLPRVARMAGTLFGRAQRYINQVKSEVNREMELDEFRRMHSDVEQAAANAGKTARESASHLRSEFDDALYDRSTRDYDAGQATSRSTSSNSNHNINHNTIHDAIAAKSKVFRKKYLARNTGMPLWYKHRTGHRVRVISAAARVARFRPVARKNASSFFS